MCFLTLFAPVSPEAINKETRPVLQALSQASRCNTEEWIPLLALLPFVLTEISNEVEV